MKKPGWTNWEADLARIQELLAKYELKAEVAITDKAGAAISLAKDAASKKYDLAIVAGGDGTISEAATGLVGSHTVMGIIPRGTFMNMSKALEIPEEAEAAVKAIKEGKPHFIDAGIVEEMNGKKLEEPFYFWENCGVGLEAELQNDFRQAERGAKEKIIQALITIFNYYTRKADIYIDDKKISRKAAMIEVSNCATSGAGLEVAPGAKMDDGKLMVSVFKMRKKEIFSAILRMAKWWPDTPPPAERHMAERIRIITARKRLFHADARIFGNTPVSIRVYPKALRVIY